MMNLRGWQMNYFGAIAMMGAVTIAPVATVTLSQAQQVAQTSIVGQCRQTNRETPVFETRGGTNPRPIDTLRANTQVRLADNGSGGLIGINAPVNGFIPAANLKLCDTTTTPPTGNTCRRVANPREGLVIRSQPSANSSRVGGVGFNERVTLTTDPATVRVGPEGRNWVAVRSPSNGWVSNGFPGSRSNLVFCQ